MTAREAPSTLMPHARRAWQNAHAPYSGFRVGAAVETVDGQVFTGANIENASYGLTVCAERVALFKAVSEGHTQLVRLALTTEQAPAAPAHGMPCGACRQVMAEFLPADTPIEVDRVGTFTLGALLPEAFVLKAPD